MKRNERETIVFGIGQREEFGQVLGERMDRRRVLRAAGMVGAAAVAGGMLKAMPAGAEAITFFKTTVNLNLREKPKTSAKVIVVMPKGSKVALVGSSGQNGFLKVDYHGATGWASADYLVAAASPDGASWVGSAKTTSNVNFRGGPSTQYEVLQVVPKGTTVKVSDWVSGGFRYCKLNGVKGWISEQYLSWQ